MTCIVGFVDNKDVYMGGDSAGNSDYDLIVRSDPKVFINEGFIFGFTGSFRMGQLLQYSFCPPKHHESVDLFEYMVTDFIDAVRECLKAFGFAEKHNEAERGGTFMVGYKGRLFTIYSDYQVGENSVPYMAIGCGDSYALGALYSMPKAIKPEKKVQLALEAAEQFSGGVRGPFIIKKLERK